MLIEGKIKLLCKCRYCLQSCSIWVKINLLQLYNLVHILRENKIVMSNQKLLLLFTQNLWHFKLKFTNLFNAESHIWQFY
jgi:hypothetical protein